LKKINLNKKLKIVKSKLISPYIDATLQTVCSTLCSTTLEQSISDSSAMNPHVDCFDFSMNNIKIYYDKNSNFEKDTKIINFIFD
jgi:hypothetical protein